MFEAGGRWGSALFRPEGPRKWAFLPSGGISVQEGMNACLDCGLLWSSVSQQAVADFISKHGTEEAKKILGLPEGDGASSANER
jgi:hypothetical protein